jgi:putative restriction endonuclease
VTHGRVPGVPVGARFRNRRSLYESGVHRDIQRDISVGGQPDLGAESVILPSQTDDNIDLGEVVYYAGSGGRDRAGKQVVDQTMTGVNRSLSQNVESLLPVRVIRTAAGEFEYRGLFLVEDAFLTRSRDGPLICRYRLRLTDKEPTSTDISEAYARIRAPSRRLTSHFRLVRDEKVPADVKKLYDFTCQICGVRLETVGGPYAEGAHLIPLGGDANGPDHISNVLCLCPNHHVLLDHGAIFLDDDWMVIDRQGAVVAKLAIHPEHGLEREYARLHRRLFDALF